MRSMERRKYSYEIMINIGCMCRQPTHLLFYSQGVVRAFQGLSHDLKNRFQIADQKQIQ